MRYFTTFCITAVVILLCLAGAAPAAEVSQGKCLQYDQQNKFITIEEYDTQFSEAHPYGQPTGIRNTYNVSKAQIGMQPEPGDILRFAFVTKGEQKMALRVMNVSKQDLRKK